MHVRVLMYIFNMSKYFVAIKLHASFYKLFLAKTLTGHAQNEQIYSRT